VIKLDAYSNPGNGAREALQRYFDEWPHRPAARGELELRRVDHMLAWLWMQGFKVVPLEAVHASNADD
jgi:hypothetical protein